MMKQSTSTLIVRTLLFSLGVIPSGLWALKFILFGNEVILFLLLYWAGAKGALYDLWLLACFLGFVSLCRASIEFRAPIYRIRRIDTVLMCCGIIAIAPIAFPLGTRDYKAMLFMNLSYALSVISGITLIVFSMRNRRRMPNQLPDPTSPSVTPPAGAGGAPSDAADH